jgi:putative ABC transport system permease protein
MNSNNFKIAWRNLAKDRQFAFLNLLGLSTGLACALLIYLWISDELQVDKFHANDKRLYQVMQVSKEDDGINVYEMTPAPLSEALPKEMPEVEYAVGVSAPGNRTGVLSTGVKQIRVTEQYAGKDFFRVFSYPLLEGDKNRVLTDPSSVVLSDELVKKLWPSGDNVVGRTLSFHNGVYSGNYKVTGVFKKPPANSTAQFDLLFPFSVYVEKNVNAGHWDNNDPSTYLVLKQGTDMTAFNQKLKGYLQLKTKNQPDENLFIRRYSDKYLYSKYENGVQTGGRIEYVRTFSIIAIFILVIACINFMNLSTAKAARRLKEVGIKKVVGATRGALMAQYLTESMLMTLLSFVVALLVVGLLLPAFNELTGKQLVLHFGVRLLLVAIGMCLFTGLMAGSYPAFYISGFNPIAVLKGKLHTSIGELWVRKGLVVFQFTISVVLIVSVLVVYRQVSFIRSKNLGFNKENVIEFKRDGVLYNSAAPFLAHVRNMPEVADASSFNGDLINNISGTGISWAGKDPGKDISFKYLNVGDRFIETFGLKMVAGRPFTSEAGADTTQIIFNETAIRAMGLQYPIGKIVQQWGQTKRIVGIVRDFHFQSLYESIKPCFLILNPATSTGDFTDNIAIKIKAGKEKEAIAGVQQYYRQYNPGFPFEFKFLDHDYQVLYESESRVGVLSRWFAGIAILISCLGLFGLAAFTAQKRQKEIGIRKVVGASVRNIAVLLSRDFLKLVAVSLLIAIPVASWVMTRWLNGFAYRIHLDGGIFVAAVAAVLVITVLAIGSQAIKAAVANPTKSLRAE